MQIPYVSHINSLWAPQFFVPRIIWQQNSIPLYYNHMNEDQKILIAEDDEFMLELLVQEMQKSGIKNISIVKTGKDILAKIKEEKPTLLLLDLILPGKDGLEALEEIRSLPEGKTLRVIVLSNLSEPMYQTKAQELGVISYLIKSNMHLSEIVDNVKEALKK